MKKKQKKLSEEKKLIKKKKKISINGVNLSNQINPSNLRFMSSECDN